MPDPYLTFASYHTFAGASDGNDEITMRFHTDDLRLPVPGDYTRPWVEAAVNGLVEDTAGELNVVAPLALVVPHA